MLRFFGHLFLHLEDLLLQLRELGIFLKKILRGLLLLLLARLNFDFFRRLRLLPFLPARLGFDFFRLA